MPLRLIEAIVPDRSPDDLQEAFDEKPILGLWAAPYGGDCTQLRILLQSEHCEAVLDWLESRYTHSDQFRTMLFAIEATLPRPEREDSDSSAGSEPELKQADRVSREELYDDALDSAHLSWVFVVMVVLSTVVASVGLLRDDVAVIIGAMVMAPLLGPNMSLAFATTLGDVQLAGRALTVNVLGLITAAALAIGTGLTVAVDADTPALAARTAVGLGDVLLALAAGTAGALSFTRGIPAALIGVMVAVALLPPLATAGLLAGAREFELAFQAALLVGINVICVNLAAVGTFLVQGIRPRAWHEADRARRATRIALAFWTGLLAVLILLMYLAQR